MKIFQFTFKLLGQALAVLILLQSCSIYRSQNISLDQAAETSRKVRVKSQGEKITLKRIEISGDAVYGYARENSSASKKLQDFGIIGRESGNFYRFNLENLKIDAIQAKNYTTSTLATIGLAAVAAFVVIAILAAGSSAVGPGFY
ncbi:hypothetical protein [Christiangramia sabulilitoris]|uniref:Lipoprotein n=1 Tax=Christiangramia sabulilitoris TaxID=2583991 RepID=A0A550I985_9FLAO|nr:hypothetical protein [Christiangramia sabulilitoris]TRO67496.1 hypothetical protein FGM01_06320 [Christiangramia sabulilitoris]